MLQKNNKQYPHLLLQGSDKQYPHLLHLLLQKAKEQHCLQQCGGM
jgi:hypothetical protein